MRTLEADWSPQQIAGWLKRTYSKDPDMQVSHEAIYPSPFVQSRGEAFAVHAVLAGREDNVAAVAAAPRTALDR